MNREQHPWRRVGAVLHCRLDIRVALRREVRHAPVHPAPVGAQTMPPEEVLRLFGQPDLPSADEEIPVALLPPVLNE